MLTTSGMRSEAAGLTIKGTMTFIKITKVIKLKAESEKVAALSPPPFHFQLFSNRCTAHHPVRIRRRAKPATLLANALVSDGTVVRRRVVTGRA
jgi:hypothetical protein